MTKNVDKFLEASAQHRRTIEKMRALLDAADMEKRELSRREKAEYDSLDREVDRLKTEIRRLNGETDPRLFRQGLPGDGGPGDGPGDFQPDILGPEQRMSDWVSERRGGRAELDGGESFSLGRIITALVRRDRSNLTETEQRALVEGTDASGGFLTPEVLASEVIDRLRAKSRTFQAGVRLVPMESDQLMFARLSGGVTPAWKAENNPISEQSMTFDRITLRPKTLPLLVKISQELFDDLSPQAAAVIEDEMLAALALELDRVILRGSGIDPEPLGVRGQTGVTLQSLGANGANLNGYRDIATAIATIRGNNLEPTAAIFNARTAGQIDNFADSTGQPMHRPPSVEQLKFLVSNVVPNNLTKGTSGAVCSEVYVAQWDQVLVGMRTDIRVRIRALDQRYAENLQLGLVCYLRADVAMRHGEAAAVITDIKP